MLTEFIQIFPENPDTRKIDQVVKILKNGGVIIYPTDSVYALGCDLYHPKALDKLKVLKETKKVDFSIICLDMSNISEFTRPLDRPTFKLIKRALPGPFTFILNSSNKIPKILGGGKKSIGVRIPDHQIPLQIVTELGNPLITTSIKDDDDVLEYSSDPEQIFPRYDGLVDVVIDGGYGNVIPSTVVDCTSGEPEIIRQGLGNLEMYL